MDKKVKTLEREEEVKARRDNERSDTWWRDDKWISALFVYFFSKTRATTPWALEPCKCVCTRRWVCSVHNVDATTHKAIACKYLSNSICTFVEEWHHDYFCLGYFFSSTHFHIVSWMAHKVWRHFGVGFGWTRSSLSCRKLQWSPAFASFLESSSFLAFYLVVLRPCNSENRHLSPALQPVSFFQKNGTRVDANIHKTWACKYLSNNIRTVVEQ